MKGYSPSLSSPEEKTIERKYPSTGPAHTSAALFAETNVWIHSFEQNAKLKKGSLHALITLHE